MTADFMTRRTVLAALGATAVALTALPGPARALSVSTATAGVVRVLSLRGGLTTGDGGFALRQAIHDTLNSGGDRLVLDLRGVTAIDDGGVNELVSSHGIVTNRGGRVVVANLPTHVNVLAITQIITVFDVYDSVDQAIAAVGG